jgi:hypothetical protein
LAKIDVFSCVFVMVCPGLVVQWYDGAAVDYNDETRVCHLLVNFKNSIIQSLKNQHELSGELWLCGLDREWSTSWFIAQW